MKTQTKNEWWLYGLVNPRSGSIRYVGQTCREKKRASAHKKNYPSLEFEKIGRCETLEEVLLWEWLMIELWQPALNIIAGGGGNPMHNPEVAKKVGEKAKTRLTKWFKENPGKAAIHSPESREKARLARIKGYRENPSTYGTKCPSVRKKMSISKKKWNKENPGRNPMLSAEVRMKVAISQGKPVRMYSLDGVFIKEFYSSAEGARFCGRGYGNNKVRDVCSGLWKSAYGYQWRWAEEGIEKLKSVKSTTQKKGVVAICVSDRKRFYFESLQCASRETGVGVSCICNCCKGLRKSAGGYIWEYA